MTAGGWVFFILFWSGIISLNVFCFGRIFSRKELK